MNNTIEPLTYADIYYATINAMNKVREYDSSGQMCFVYDGHYDANAVSLFLSKEKEINVTSNDCFNDAFNDAFNGLPPTRETIADRIIKKFNANGSVDLSKLMGNVGTFNQDQYQNWDDDSTVYEFRDGSNILVLNGTISASLGKHTTTPALRAISPERKPY